MVRKRIYALLLAAAMLLVLMSGCQSPSGAATSAPPSQSAPASEQPDPDSSKTPDAPRLDIPDGAVDFSDGRFDFVMINETPGDADSSQLSVADNRLKIELIGSDNPYLAIDASSLLGERVSDLRVMEMGVRLENPDGQFYASSGYITAFSGEKRVESQDSWVIYSEAHNPRVIRAELTDEELFIPDAFNFFVFTKQSDAAVDARKTANNIYIEYIVFYDADGKALPIDTSASFNAPTGYGKLDWSGLYNVPSPQIIPDSSGKGTAGEQAVTLTNTADGGSLDTSLIVPGSVLTIQYSSMREPYISLNGGAAVKALYTNASGSISQFTYDELVAIHGSDNFSDLSSLSVSNPDADLAISKISIGQSDGEAETSLIPVKDGVTIEGAAGVTNAAWTNAFAGMATTKEDPENPIDFSLIGPNTVFVAVYESEVSPYLIWHSYTEGHPAEAKWAQTQTELLENGVAQWTYDQMVAEFGTADVDTFLDMIFMCGGAPLKLVKLRICQTR